MNQEREDPILDACLEEVLGGLKPPDLSERVLSAHRARLAANPAVPSRAPQRVEEVAPNSAPVVRSPRRRLAQPSSGWPLVAATVGLALVLLLGVVGGLLWQGQPPAPLTATHASRVEPAGTRVAADSEAIAQDSRTAPQNNELSLPPPSPSGAEVASDVTRIGSQTAEAEAAVTVPSTVALEIPDQRPSRVSDGEIVRAINELVRAEWTAAGLEPADAVGDAQWCGRLYEKLLGRVPSEAELARFTSDKSPDKRARLIDTLLRGEMYVEEFAGHWSELWTETLLDASVRSANRDGLAQYLRQAFGQGRPLDEVAFELLTAIGGGRPGAEQASGAANYLLAHADRDGKHRETTAHVSRVFLGMSVGCAQCHDHPIAPVGQRTFWELNAFLRQLRLEPDQGREWRLVDQDFAGEGTTSQEAEIYYSQRDGLLKAAYPVFVDGTALPRTGRLQEVDRRKLLATMVVRSEEFRQAMVNRVWEQMFGRGFTVPVDDMGPHNLPSHPILLSKLAGQFAAHDFDTRALIRWIASSEPFGLSSHLTGERTAGERLFACYPSPRPEPQPILQSLQQAGELYAQAKDSNGGLAASRIATPRASPTAGSTVLVPQTGLSNLSASFDPIGQANPYRTLILRSDIPVQAKIEHLFYATVHRAPSPRELAAVHELLAKDPANSAALWDYVWWGLSNSREAR